MIPRDRMLVLQMAAQQAAAMKQGGKQPAKKKLSETEAAIQSAMNGKGIAAKRSEEDGSGIVELEDDAPMTELPSDQQEELELSSGSSAENEASDYSPEE